MRNQPDRKDKLEGGFTLIELLVAMALAVVVGLAGYMIFASSNWSYKIQEDLAEAQQGVRVGMDRLAKDIRHAGFGLPDPPFSLTIGSQTLTSTITVNNFITASDEITILGIGYEAGALLKGASTDCNDSGKSKICLDSGNSTDKFFDTSWNFMTERKYVSLNGATFIELATTQTERTSLKLTLSSPSSLDRDYPDGTSVYIIQAVRYTIATDLTGCSSTNRCLASEDFTKLRGSGRQVIAENIEDIQFAYGTDASPLDGEIDDSDGSGSYDDADFADSPGDSSSIIAVRVNVISMTRNADSRSGDVFTRPAAEDRAAGSADAYRRRALTKIIKVRVPKTG